MTTLNVPLQLRRGSQASHPTVMLSGEVYVCLDTGLLFCGTGSGVIQVGGGSAPSGAANLVYATPNGSSGSASLRALVAADIPQLAYTSLSGLPQLPITVTGVSHKFLTSFSSLTGLFTQAQPAFSDISGTATNAQLTNNSLTVAGDGTVLSSSGSTIALGASGSLSLVSQASGTVLAGPATGANVAPTFRALVATDIPQLAYSSLSGLPTIPSSFAWNVEGNATGNLTLANAGFTTTFNQTSSVPWLWANTTIATGLTTNASPLLELAANYWTGAASAQDLWTLQSSLVAGTNGATTLAFTQAGSTGYAAVTAPNLFASTNVVSSNLACANGANPSTAGSCTHFFSVGTGCLSCSVNSFIGWGSQNNASSKSMDISLSRLSAGVLGVGTGAAAGFAGTLKLQLIILNNGGSGGSIQFVNANTNFGSNGGYLRMINAGVGNGFSLDLNGNSLFGTLCGFSTNTLTASDTGISRLAAASLAIGNGTASDVSGGLTLTTITQQSANAAQWVKGQASELLTLSTVGLTTDTTGFLLPANSIIEAVVCRVTTTITTTTNWAVGDATIAARFSAANTTLIAGTTSVGIQQCDQTGTSGPKQVAASKVRITCTGSNPGAGIVRITVFYRQFVAPTS